MTDHLLGHFQLAAVLQIVGDPDGAKAVAANFGADAGQARAGGSFYPGSLRRLRKFVGRNRCERYADPTGNAGANPPTIKGKPMREYK